MEIGKITYAGIIIGICLLAFCTVLLAIGKFELGLDIDALRTLVVVAIVFGSQATVYAIRDRRHFFGLKPTLWLLFSSVVDILIISALAVFGLAMKSLSLEIVASEFAAAIVFWVVLSWVKLPVFSRLGIS